MLKKIFSNTNIIIAIVLIFVLWLMFFDKNSMLSLSEVTQKIEEKRIERDFYRTRIAEDSAVIVGLSDSAFVEKYARENFFLVREGETLYLTK